MNLLDSKARAAVFTAALLCAAGQALAHGRPHDVMNLDVTVDADRITLEADAPLDSLIGFGRAPKTDAQRTAAASFLARMDNGAWLVAIDPQSGCTLERAEVLVPALGHPSMATEVKRVTVIDTALAEHGSFNATYEFKCPSTGAMKSIPLTVFESFGQIRTITARVAGTGGQFLRTIRHADGDNAIPLTR